MNKDSKPFVIAAELKHKNTYLVVGLPDLMYSSNPRKYVCFLLSLFALLAQLRLLLLLFVCLFVCVCVCVCVCSSRVTVFDL